jgi:hypothetical protein
VFEKPNPKDPDFKRFCRMLEKLKDDGELHSCRPGLVQRILDALPQKPPRKAVKILATAGAMVLSFGMGWVYWKSAKPRLIRWKKKEI